MALWNPWDVDTPPCVPDCLTLPSYKFATRCKTTFTTNTIGVGYAAYNPYTPWNDGNTATGVGCQVICSNYTGIHQYYTNDDVTLGYAVASNGDSPFTQGDLVVNQFRVVGGGISARYIGSEINRSGMCISWRDSNNSSIAGSSTSTSDSGLLANREAVTNPVTREWHYAIWRPAVANDITYQGPATYALATPCVMLLVSGAEPSINFEVDSITWFEVIGSNVPQLTPSHADLVGLSVVNSAMATHQPIGTPKQNLNSFMREATRIANETLSYVAPIVDVGMKVGSVIGAFM